MSRRVAALFGCAILLAAHAADARPPRHLICHDEQRPRPPRPSASAGPPISDWVRLPRRRPPTLELAKLEIFDVAESDPMPSRRVATERARPHAEQTPLVLLESRNDWRCIGVPRGTPGIARVSGAPPGSRFHGQPRLESWRQDNMQAAGVLALFSTKGLLRRQLERPIPEGIEAWQAGELRRSKHVAARALADLGDAASAPRVLMLLRSLEREGFHLWRDTLDSLGRLDPQLAQSYALELFERAAERPEWLRGNPTLYTDLLPLISVSSPRALAVLRRISGMLTKDNVNLPHGSGGCELVAARVRLGDADLRRELRTELGTGSLDTQRAVACYSALMPALYPGIEGAELPVLMHRLRYESILAFLESTRAGGSAAERARLLAWLRQRSSAPDVAGDRQRRDFVPDRRAMHLAALAALGDVQGKQKLAELITDPNDDGTAPWVAAYFALRLELERAAELAVERLLIARHQHTRRHSSESWPRRGALVITAHGRVLEELVRRRDDRFALGLLDRQAFTRSLTTAWLARKRPSSACKLVGDAAHRASPEAIDEAFWALSVLGQRCRATMQRLVADSSQPAAVRGMANEHLAMLRDQTVPANNRLLSTDSRYAPTISRARIIHAAPE
jgi:hypothetical protein